MSEEKRRDDPALAATLASDPGSGPLPRTRPGETEIRDTHRDAAARASGEAARLDPAPRVSGLDMGLASTLASDSGMTLAGAPHPAITITSEHPARYERESEIGRGGMGRVVIAVDRHLGRTVAMKELLGSEGIAAELGMSVGTIARFLREARITGQLEHPGIVPVHELGRRSDGTLYYTMKRIRGRSLAAVLKESRSLEDRLRLIAPYRAVCEAMAYAHTRGVVHRDLKPDNVMVGEFGETLVVDWGLAKVRGEDESALPGTSDRVAVTNDAAKTVGGVAMGTPAYMSPEQARGDLRSIDERTDVWGLGAMLFEILTGRPPFVGTSVLDVLRQVMEERPPRVRELEPDAPPELAAIAERALMADPTSRYPSAREVASEIAAWQDGHQVRAYEYSSLDRIRRFVERNRAATIAVAVVAVALVASSALIYRSYLREEAARVRAETERDSASRSMHDAEDAARRAEIAVAEALLDRAERALSDGDPAGAAVYAAGVLVRDAELGEGLDRPAAEARDERDVRARSIELEAAERCRYVFERVVVGAHHRSALSTDGGRVAIPTERDLRVVDLSREDAETRVPVAAERVLLVTPDGTAAIDGASPGLYALDDGRSLLTTGRLSDADLSGDRLALVEDGAVRVVSASTREELGRLTGTSDVEEARFIGERLVLRRGSAMSLETTPFPFAGAPTSIPLGTTPFAIDVSSDGGRIGTVILDSALLVVEPLVPTPSVLHFGTRGWATSVRWDGTGSLAVLEDGNRVVLLDTAEGRPVETLHVVANGGGRLVSGGDRVGLFPYALTATVRGAPLFRRGGSLGPDVRDLPTPIRDVVVDAARTRTIAATIDAVYAIALGARRLGGPQLLFQLPPDVGITSRIAVRDDGVVFVVTSRGALVAGSGTSAEIVVPPGPRTYGGVLGLAVHDAEILVGNLDGTVRRLSVDGYAPLGSLVGHEGPVTAITFSPDGDRIATASSDGDVRIWASRTGESERVLEGHADLAADVVFTIDGARVVTADGQGRVRIFDLSDGHLAFHTLVHHRWINRLALSSDGVHVATASDDGSIRVIDVTDLSARRIHRLRAAPLAVAFDGSRLVYHDGHELVRLDLRLGVEPPAPAATLEAAEGRAGVTLEGLELTPRTH